MNTKYITLSLISTLLFTCFYGCLEIDKTDDENPPSDMFSILIQPTFSFTLNSDAHIICNMHIIKQDTDAMNFISYEKFINISENNITKWKINSTNFTFENKNDALFIEGIISYLEDKTNYSIKKIISYDELKNHKNDDIYPITITINSTQEPTIIIEDLIEVRATTTIHVYRSQTPLTLINEKVRIDFTLNSGENYIYNETTNEQGFVHLENISFFISESDHIKITATHKESGYFCSVTYTPQDSDKLYGDWYSWETKFDLFG